MRCERDGELTLKTVLKGTYAIVLVFLGLNLALIAGEAPSELNKAQQNLNLGARYRLRPNDSPSTINFFPLPYIRYSNQALWQPKLNVYALSAGIYNRLGIRYNLTPNYFLKSSGSALFFYGGDSPRIDGSDFDGRYEFGGHRYDYIFGLGRDISVDDFSLEVFIGYRLVAHQFYDYPATNSFVAPGQFIDHGAHFNVSSSSKVSSEINELGFRPRLTAEYFRREKSRAWGANSNLKNIKSYFGIEAESRLAIPVSATAVLVSNTQMGYINQADRINAISDGSNHNKGMGMFLANVKTDRTISEDLGIRYYPETTKRIAIKPYSFVAIYRELTPDHNRNNWGLGGGLKVMGASFKSKFDWELNYGVISHVDRSRTLLHEVSALLNLRIFP